MTANQQQERDGVVVLHEPPRTPPTGGHERQSGTPASADRPVPAGLCTAPNTAIAGQEVADRPDPGPDVEQGGLGPARRAGERHRGHRVVGLGPLHPAHHRIRRLADADLHGGRGQQPGREEDQVATRRRARRTPSSRRSEPSPTPIAARNSTGSRTLLTARAPPGPLVAVTASTRTERSGRARGCHTQSTSVRPVSRRKTSSSVDRAGPARRPGRDRARAPRAAAASPSSV